MLLDFTTIIGGLILMFAAYLGGKKVTGSKSKAGIVTLVVAVILIAVAVIFDI